MDAATKQALLDLVESAVGAGWSRTAALGYLQLPSPRYYRWLARRDRLEDLSPGGNPVHGLLDDEVSEILAVFDQWGDVDRSHRKLAHRGSYEHRFWASPATVLRVLTAAGLRFRSRPRPARTAKRPIPDWVTYGPNRSGFSIRPISVVRRWRC